MHFVMTRFHGFLIPEFRLNGFSDKRFYPDFKAENRVSRIYRYLSLNYYLFYFYILKVFPLIFNVVFFFLIKWLIEFFVFISYKEVLSYIKYQTVCIVWLPVLIQQSK